MSAERYALPLPQLTGEVETLADRVEKNLNKIGWFWQAVSVELFASKYQLYLPSKEVLKAQLEKIEAELEGER